MRISIRWGLIVGLIILLCVTTGTIIISSYVNSQKVLTGLTKEIMRNIATFSIEKSQSYLIPARKAAELTQKLADSHVVDYKNPKSLEHYLHNQLSSYFQFAGIYYGDIHGDFTYVNRDYQQKNKGFRTKIIQYKKGKRTAKLIWRNADFKKVKTMFDPSDKYDPRSRPWFQKALQYKKLIWTNPYVFFSSQKAGITTASPVFDKQGRIAGVVGVDIELDAISKFMAKLKVGKNGIAFILTQNGDLIAYPDTNKLKMPTSSGKGFRLTKILELSDAKTKKAFLSIPKPLSELKKGESIFTTFEHQEKKYSAMFASFTSPEWPWIIGVYLPEDDYSGEVKKNQKDNLSIAIAITLFSSVVLYLLANTLIQPMRYLQKDAKAIENFDLTQNHYYKTIYKELNDMNVSFQKMKIGLEAFGKYVPKKLVRSLITQNQTVPKGVQKELTIFFTDIKDFTTIAERLTPIELSEQLNEYLEEVSKIIQGREGTIDKFIGDAVMAFWGAPDENSSNHAYQACLAAIEIQKQIKGLNQIWTKQGRPTFYTRIGINTGEAIVGSFGSNERFSYTCLGDAVNLASRLEEVNKTYETSIIIGENTYLNLKGQFITRKLDHVFVKGKDQATTIYELLGIATDLTQDTIKMTVVYEDALQSFFDQDYQSVINILSKSDLCKNDHPSQILLEKAQQKTQNKSKTTD
ncbi:MAG: adenylate cyclase [bacterium]|jgi:adenylate cyclase